jgi:hypothetical protein
MKVLLLVAMLVGITTVPQPTLDPASGPYAIPMGVPFGYKVEMDQVGNAFPFIRCSCPCARCQKASLMEHTSRISVRPGPTYGELLAVSGTLTKSNRILLPIGNEMVALTIHGSLNAHHIMGSAENARLGILDFRAVRVHLKRPPQET